MADSAVKAVNSILPDSNGNVTLTPSSINAISSILLDAVYGIPTMNQNKKVKDQYLPDPIANNAMGFRGKADTNTVPLPGFYIATIEGSYTRFNQSSSTIIYVSKEEIQNNVVIFHSIGNFWTKLLVPLTHKLTQSIDWSQITNRPTISAVGHSGSFKDLIDAPVLHKIATSGSYSDLQDKPDFAAVALSGNYSDLKNVPSDLIRRGQCDLPKNPPLLNNFGQLDNEALSEAARQLGGMMFIGAYTPSRDPSQAIQKVTTDIFAIATLPGEYTYFPFTNNGNKSFIRISQEELDSYLVIIYGRTEFFKYLIPLPTLQISAWIRNPWGEVINTSSLELSPEAITLSCQAQTFTLTIVAAEPWELVSYPFWMTPNKTSGAESTTIDFNVSYNTDPTPRSYTIQVQSEFAGIKTCSVYQQEIDKYLTVAPMVLSFFKEGGDLSLAITSNTNWTIIKDPNLPAGWSVSPLSGSNNGSIVISAPENTDPSLINTYVKVKGDLVAAQQTINISQEAAQIYSHSLEFYSGSYTEGATPVTGVQFKADGYVSGTISDNFRLVPVLVTKINGVVQQREVISYSDSHLTFVQQSDTTGRFRQFMALSDFESFKCTNLGRTEYPVASNDITFTYMDTSRLITTSKVFKITQDANIKSYDNVTINSLSVGDIPASGGSMPEPVFTATQNIRYSSGALTPVTSFNFTYIVIVGSNLGTTQTSRTFKGTSRIDINGQGGKSASQVVSVYQQANQILVTSYQASRVIQLFDVGGRMAAPQGDTATIRYHVDRVTSYTSGAEERTPLEKSLIRGYSPQYFITFLKKPSIHDSYEAVIEIQVDQNTTGLQRSFSVSPQVKVDQTWIATDVTDTFTQKA